jgi:D-glycero-D-manno-heptose 1,7-bisphosphate phosphatase
MNAAVFLDRDNTLIHNEGDLGDPEGVRLMQGAASAVSSLQGLGYKVVVVTNQGAVARGACTESDVEAVHKRIDERIRRASGGCIDCFYYCPYHPQGTVEAYRREHPWRKPQPGMIRQAAEDLELDLSQSWLIGDQPRDIRAGAAAGLRTILLDRSAPEIPAADEGRAAISTPAEDTGEGESEGPKPDFTARSLVEAVRIVAQRRRPGGSAPTAPEARERFRAARDLASRSQEVAASDVAGTKGDAPRAQRPFRPLEFPQAPPEESAPAAEQAPETEDEAAPSEGGADQARAEAQKEAAAKPPESGEPASQGSGKRRPASRAETNRLLRQILQELRRASDEGEEGAMGLMALLLQIGAGVCLAAALLMGGGEPTVFFQWLGVGVLVQLGVIAALLARGPS